MENATVRAAAVSTLAKFGAMVDSLKVEVFSFLAKTFSVVIHFINLGAAFGFLFQPRIFILLKRCLFDNDDEVCRVVLY